MIKILTKLFNKESSKQSIVEPKPAEPQHEHTWTLVAQTFAPPVSISSNLTDSYFLEKAAFGVTTLLWDCDKCSLTKKEEMLGSENETMEELIKKVKMTGPQFVERDGETYVFNRWVPASSVPGNIPIR